MGNGNTRDLVIGFDFGTAATKIVVRDPSLRRAHAIPFQELAHPSSPYLLPTELMLSKSGEFLLKCDDPAVVFRHLKIHLLDSVAKYIIVNGQELEIKPTYLAAIYMALVLRRVRDRFLNDNRQIYSHVAPFWQLNIGLPAKNYDNDTICENFLNAAKLGWWLSQRNEPLNLSILQTLDTIRQRAIANPGIHPDYINAVPEIAAQVAGYAKSQARQNGLHVLIDIGATTIDVAAFRLDSKDGQDYYAFMAADVSRFGCYELHAWRAAKISEYLPEWLRRMDCACDMVLAVPEKLDPYCPKPTDFPNFDEDFMGMAVKTLTGVVAKTKKDRDPNAMAWQSGLPLFLCGGGSNMKFYKESLISNARGILTTLVWSGFQRKEIPKPEALQAESLHAGEFHRLSVAFGLSYPVDDIGRIVPAREIEDIPIQRSGKVYELITKDMV